MVLIEQLFGPIPIWVVKLIVLLLLAWAGMWLIAAMKRLWVNDLRPMFHSIEKRRLVRRRQLFAQHLERELHALNSSEDWRDHQFAELEAEVEAEGARRIGLLPLPWLRRRGLRRERSLSSALANSNEQLILVEGEPGSGKSVALRHVALLGAHKAAHARSPSAVIPIYLNLKQLRRKPGQKIDRTLIRNFVFDSINRFNDRDIDQLLEDEFDNGIRDGTWLFLLDSFDELPDVLTATDGNEVIVVYSRAISDFLGGMNRCRGIIASREYRGPSWLGWPKFRIMELQPDRQRELIRKADLDADRERLLLGSLGAADLEMRQMARNPMFLCLICERMRDGAEFPDNAYVVFDEYVKSRLTRDGARLEARYRMDAVNLLNAAEALAFTMAATEGLGLSPDRKSLLDACKAQGFNGLDGGQHLDALEYLKLAQPDLGHTQTRAFTFAHRRFQEYFATRVVLREPDRVPPSKLLTDARWRETTVVLCQTQPRESLTPLLDEATRMLSDMATRVQVAHADTPGIYAWPTHTLHLLGLLQSGLGRRREDLPASAREHAAKLVLTASEKGTRLDAKWALDLAGTLPEERLEQLLHATFAGPSALLCDVAFWQVARLATVTREISQGINRALLWLFASGYLWRERHATRAHLSRLTNAEHPLNAHTLLLYVGPVDYMAHATTLLFVPGVYVLGGVAVGGPRSIVIEYYSMTFLTSIVVLLGISSLYYTKYAARTHLLKYLDLSKQLTWQHGFGG